MNTGDSMTGDTALAERVTQALESNDATAGRGIDAAAIGSSITLSGEVRNQQEKETAEQIARGVDGVVDVTNELTIGTGGGLRLFGRQDDDDGRSDDGGTVPGTMIPGVAAGALAGGGSTGGTASGAGYAAPAAGLAAGLVDRDGGDDDRDQEKHELRSESEADDTATGG